MQNIDWTKVEEAQEFEKVVPGGYVCIITHVQDDPSKEYLNIECDIAEGTLKNYYRKLYESKGFWGLKFIRSYKEKARPFFKGFITAVENTNKGYKFNNDERTLIKKGVGLVLAEEEYTAKDGTVKTRLYVAEIHTVDRIRKGDFTVPPLKKLSSTAGASQSYSAPTTPDFEEILSDDDDLPF